MRPICVKCHRFFRAKKNGFNFTEGMPRGSSKLPTAGMAEPEDWMPYKVWSGDLYECQGCGAQIIAGFGTGPISVRHEYDFERTRKALGADQYQVNDC